MVNIKELLEAKVSLRKLLIKEHGEEVYQDHILNRVKWLADFKNTGDKIFGKDDKMFREEVRKAITEKYKNTDKILYEFVITDIALDTFLE